MRQKTPNAVLTALCDNEGQITHDINSLCQDFYESLYARPMGRASQTERDNILDLIRPKFSHSMNATLGREISQDELLAAAKAMAKQRAPSPDGVGVEFFLFYWDLLGGEFTNLIKYSLISGALPQGMTRGLIFLLFKAGEREKLGNWRPLTLLNVTYKMLAKLLQLRLSSMLPKVISPDQTAFVPARFILDNILLTHETIDWARRSKQRLLFLN